MSGRRWSGEDDARLREMVETIKDLGAIARTLNRSELSVATRMRDLGIRFGTRGGQPTPPVWTKDDDAFLLANARKMPLSEIADKLGRTWQSAKRRLARLRHENRDTGGLPGVIRPCLACGVMFHRKPGEPYFLCQAHRHESVSPYAPGGMGDNGRQVRAARG